MINVLIVDDEKIEREGLKYLISTETKEHKIFEASNGREALQILREEDIQLLLTDIKMPHMTGLELSKKAKEEQPDLQIIIFSGFSDFAFAQEAIRYGVTEYILKPVNPEDFHRVIQRAEVTIASRIKKESREIKEKIFLQQYFLQNYLYSGKKEVLEKAGELIDLNKWNDWHCAILLESDVAFFDTAEENLDQVLQQELRRKIFYLNLNGRQSLVLFQDVYCDYQLVANHIYNFMKREYMERFYLAVSRKFEGYENLPSVLEQLEQQMEISKVTLALSTFYRTALSKGEDMVTVETCIRNMEAYLEIQLTMHDHNFTVEWETDPDIKNEKMPKLLLQPVVENAIEHGIDEKEEGDKKLFLSFKGQGDDVEIIVRDNGTGMEQEKAETLVTYQAKGYGLKNVNDRIRLLYGESYGIQIYSAPGEGTTVIMRFPKEIKNYEE